MGYEQIQQFLTFPNLPDVITYILYIIILITMAFLKAFVKKDNRSTIYKVDTRTNELDKVISDFEKEKSLFEKERKKLQKELKVLKEVIKKQANNSRELVANGTANEISTIIDDCQNVEE